VSICIPVYNGARYLRPCLDSALAQTLRSIEILVVDDGSTDESVAIAAQYAAADARVRVERNPGNLGLVGNWNRCIELARGEWIKFLFQDDWLEPECIARLVANAGDSRMVFCARDFAFEAPAPQLQQSYAKFVGAISLAGVFGDETQPDAPAFCRALSRFPIDNFLGEPTSVMLRRDLFQRFGVFDPRFVQLCDFEFFARVGAQSGMAWVPDVLAHFRVHGDSATALNLHSKAFATRVIEPLLLMHDYASQPAYSLFREICAGRNVDCAGEFRQRLIYERRWGKQSREKGWVAAEKRYPFLRLDASNRARHVVQRLLRRLGIS